MINMTTTKQVSEVSFKAEDLTERIKKAIHTIDEYAFINNYRILRNDVVVENGLWNIIDTTQLEPLIMKMTLSARKKIAKKLRHVENKVTLKSSNVLIASLRNKIGIDTGTIKIKISDKEDKIQTARKEWIKLRDQASVALLNYKTIKGTFYKDQIK